MQNKSAITALAVISLFTSSAAVAAGNDATQFKTGVISAAQVMQSKHTSKLGTAFNQLYICNQTNLPSQIGVTIQVAFPQAGVPAQFPTAGQCAYLSSSAGGFNTQAVIYAPSNNTYPIYNNTVSSGQMWGVSYNGNNNTYPVFRMQ